MDKFTDFLFDATAFAFFAVSAILLMSAGIEKAGYVFWGAAAVYCSNAIYALVIAWLKGYRCTD